MAESFVEEGVARVRTVVKRADRRIQKAQKQIESRRKSFEKELGSIEVPVFYRKDQRCKTVFVRCVYICLVFNKRFNY